MHTHRGLRDEQQRIACDWWLYLHTQLPGDPVEIARQENWGQDALAKAQTLANQEKQATSGHEDGRPATYDSAGLRVKMCVWLGVSRGLDLAFLNAD